MIICLTVQYDLCTFIYVSYIHNIKEESSVFGEKTKAHEQLCMLNVFMNENLSLLKIKVREGFA